MKSILVFAAIFTFTIATGQAPALKMKPIKSDVYAWKNLPVQKTQNAERRQILDGSGATLSNIEIHATTLNPGTVPQPGHTHDEEVMVIIKEGSLKVRIQDKTQVLGPGSVAFAIPKEELAFENAGSGKVTYYILKFKSDSANLQRGVNAGGSFMMNWNDIVFKPHDKGGVRQYFNRPTATLKRFDIHVTTLNAGLKSHDPHTHKVEEIILMIDGNAEMQIADSFKKTSAGDLIFLESNVSHAIRNDDTKPCMYYAIQWE
jgi:(S)-ureidoglycine aminohydrolase